GSGGRARPAASARRRGGPAGRRGPLRSGLGPEVDGDGRLAAARGVGAAQALAIALLGDGLERDPLEAGREAGRGLVGGGEDPPGAERPRVPQQGQHEGALDSGVCADGEGDLGEVQIDEAEGTDADELRPAVHDDRV
ncbi:MAG: hypothetical protein ACK559_08090, partial [bacterium]